MTHEYNLRKANKEPSKEEIEIQKTVADKWLKKEKSVNCKSNYIIRKNSSISSDNFHKICLQ